jgi:hypothetical protein
MESGMIKQKYIFVVFMAALFCLLHFAFSSQTNEYVYQVPKKLNDGWEVASLSDVGLPVKAIEYVRIQLLVRSV